MNPRIIEITRLLRIGLCQRWKEEKVVLALKDFMIFVVAF